MSPPVSFRRGLIPAAVACLAAFTIAGPARADSASFVSDPGLNNLGSFTGSLSVSNSTVSGVVQSVLTVTLVNTTGPSNPGTITGFAFNDPNSASPGKINTVTLNSVTENGANRTGYNVFGGGSYYNSVSGQPYGNFDVGIGNGSSLLGGNPNSINAINAGNTGVFTITIKWDKGYTGSPMASDFLASMSTGGGQPGVGLLVRFQDFWCGTSDKVPYTGPYVPPPSGGNGGAVPAPPGMLLGLIGIGGCLFGRGFRRRTAAATA